MLIFIQGGPEIFANKAFEEDIVNHPEFVAHKDDYRWTPRTITSTVDPTKVAQVWEHVSVASDSAPSAGVSPVPTAAEQPNATASDSTTQEAQMETATAVSSPPTVAASSTSGSSDEDSRETVVTHGDFGDGVPREIYADTGEPVPQDYTGPAVEVGDDGDLLDGEQLFLLRRRRKLTVKEVADATGLATSKISAIEKGTGKRIRPGEVRTLQDYLQGGDTETPRS
jgi:hypothetical protein